MEDILQQLGLERLVQSFHREEITPDIVAKLSTAQMELLGVKDRADMMKLRLLCLTFGSDQPRKKNNREFDIPKEYIQGLLENNFSVLDICRMISVSESTVYRKMRMFNLSKLDFDDIEDNVLDTIVKQITVEFPHCGETMIGQILRQQGTKVTRSQLRDSLYRLDEAGIKERSRRRLSRRVYNVAGVNHLWHIDTNHKLIRWRFIIVGGIDGFSRFITFLRCTDNNKAETVLECFENGVREFGLPLRVRSDKGMENLKVAEYMIRMRGPNSGSMVTGKSTHNQRIERLWRDVFEGVLSFYYDLFYFMEDNNILDVMNDLHIFALHHVYLLKINEKLTIWRQAWATHRMRTIKTSPLRLFTAGTSLNNLPSPVTVDIHGAEGDLAEDFDGEEQHPRPTFYRPSGLMNNEERVKQLLHLQCPKEWTSSNHGIDVFTRALSIIERNND